MTSAVLAVIAEPDLAPPDRARIDRLRRRFDPRYRTLPTHLTLVFPQAGLSVADARRMLRSVLGRAPGTVQGRLAGAETIRTPGPHGWFVVLPVASGAAALARLHARLSQGPFHGNRRGPTPYRPHVTVAAGLTAAAAQRARRLAAGPGMPFRIRSAALVRWDGARLETLARCRLGGR